MKVWQRVFLTTQETRSLAKILMRSPDPDGPVSYSIELDPDTESVKIIYYDGEGKQIDYRNYNLLTGAEISKPARR
jgi:hypothetical protein